MGVIHRWIADKEDEPPVDTPDGSATQSASQPLRWDGSQDGPRNHRPNSVSSASGSGTVGHPVNTGVRSVGEVKLRATDKCGEGCREDGRVALLTGAAPALAFTSAGIRSSR